MNNLRDFLEENKKYRFTKEFLIKVIINFKDENLYYLNDTTVTTLCPNDLTYFVHLCVNETSNSELTVFILGECETNIWFHENLLEMFKTIFDLQNIYTHFKILKEVKNSGGICSLFKKKKKKEIENLKHIIKQIEIATQFRSKSQNDLDKLI